MSSLRQRLDESWRSLRERSTSVRRSALPWSTHFRFLWQVFSPQERWLASLGLVLGAIGLILLGIGAYFSLTIALPQVGGRYVEATIGTPKYINPLYASGNDVDLDITRLVFSGLLRKDENLQLVPDLAESYEISEDQKTYTFHLRQNVAWHNAKPFSGSDVLFTVQAIQDRAYKSPLAALLAGVTVEKVDETTVTFTLTEPFAPFLEAMDFGILSADEWSTVAPDQARVTDRNLKPVGTGPFQFDRLLKDSDGNIIAYRLRRNPNYYAAAAYLDEIEFRFFGDFDEAATAVQNGKVDGLSFVPKKYTAALAKSRKVTLHTLHLPQYTALFFNQKRNPILQNLDVRQALAYALDRERIINQGYGGQASIINTPIPPGYLGHNSEVVARGYDQNTARKMLDDAGWAFLEGEQYRKKGEQTLELTLTTVDERENIAVANLVREMWEAVNIKVNLVVTPATTINNEVIKPRNYDVILYGQIIGTDPDPYPFWHSSQNQAPGVNLAVSSNRQIDQLLVEARKITDPDERRLKYLHFQNILADELPAIFLYNPTYTYALARNIKGYDLQRLTEPADRFTNVERWHLEENRVWKF